MPRDRLAELKAEASADDDVEIGDVEADIQEASSGSFMADFFKKIQAIKDLISNIEGKITQVEHKHADLLVAVSKAQQKEISDSLNALTDDISQTSNKARRMLKAMDDQNKEETKMAKITDPMSADTRIRKSQHAALARKFVSVMTRFSEIQAANKMKQRDLVKRQCRIVDPNMSEQDIENVAENGVGENIFSGKRLAEAEAALTDIQDRHQDIVKLEKSLVELHEMFLDLSIMIESQGEMIDRIEFSVNNAEQYVGNAVKQLGEAKKLKGSIFTKQILIIICCLCIAGVIVAAIIGPLASLGRVR